MKDVKLSPVITRLKKFIILLFFLVLITTFVFRKLISKDWDERLEDDKLILERILILIRNILQGEQVSEIFTNSMIRDNYHYQYIL